MAVTIPVPLTPEERATLQAQAQAQGVSVDSLLRKAVLQIISAAKDVKPRHQLTADEVNRGLDEAADLIPEGVPPLSDEAMSRESIYTREDDWNR